MVSQQISQILEVSSKTTDPIHIRGAAGSAGAYFIARLIEAEQKSARASRPRVILCPSDELALDFCSDLESLSLPLLGKRLKILYLPTWEHSPYSPITPSLRTRFARLAALVSLAQTSGPDAVVTTLAASFQATLPKHLLTDWTLHLHVKSFIPSQGKLASQLVERGYQRVDPVEDPGTFSIRGDILDIFPPQALRPFRIEFFDDEIERIREIDPRSQRTLVSQGGEIQELIVPPAREALINANTTDLLRQRLKTHADNHGISRSIRDPILAAIKNGIYPDYSDLWTPFIFEQPSNLWNYLTPLTENDPMLVTWVDRFRCQQNWSDFRKEQDNLQSRPEATDRILPQFDELYQNTQIIDQPAKQTAEIYLDQVALLDPTSNLAHRHHFEISINPHSETVRAAKGSLSALQPVLKSWLRSGFKLLILTSTQTQLERFEFLLTELGLTPHRRLPAQQGTITLALGHLSQGFEWLSEGLILMTEDEILMRSGSKSKKSREPKNPASGSGEWSDIQALSDLNIKDLIVHRDHGIGQYQGLMRLTLAGAPSDFLQLEYANKDKLYLPIYRLNVIQKYTGAGGSAPLDRLGSQQFALAKAKAKDSAKSLAVNLLQLYAERKVRQGIRFGIADAEYSEFEAKFPFDETPDQLKAIQDVLSDLESGQMMDRLVCGDVGYGKTEVAMRAAFRAVSEGKQVAVLVPTTILALQHEQTFKTRMKDYPLIIESVTRFKTATQQKGLLQALGSGKLDIVIGTHRLLSKDVHFNDLGLLIVDEEHRFGVEHKERLKTYKVNTHVLTLTATPIPRTLHMCLSGLRDISLMRTPPADRLPIRTYVSKYDEGLVKKAIEFELARGGQVFFLHNRVQNIHKIAEDIQRLVPAAQVVVAHGQMKEDELERKIHNFYHKHANVLVTTTIIESGLDLPSANTILINRADALGLAQLYQVRGRVGRSQQRGYAYLFIPQEDSLGDDAIRRLEAIQKFVELGSGFNIASHDLEIRGGGDLLGPHQSGNMNAVGFDLFTELLEEAIRELQNKPAYPDARVKEPEIKTPFPAFFSEEFVTDVRQRLSFYRRFSACRSDSEVTILEEELRDRFGKLPSEAVNFIWLIKIKITLKMMGIDSLTMGADKIALLPGADSPFDPARTIALICAHPERYQLTPDSKLVVTLAATSIQNLYFELTKLCKTFSPGSEAIQNIF